MSDSLVDLVAEVRVVTHGRVHLSVREDAPFGGCGDRLLARKARVLERLDDLPHVGAAGECRAAPGGARGASMVCAAAY
jgi:hypothetical protein